MRKLAELSVDSNSWIKKIETVSKGFDFPSK